MTDAFTILVLIAAAPVLAFGVLHAYAQWSIRHIDDPCVGPSVGVNSDRLERGPAKSGSGDARGE